MDDEDEFPQDPEMHIIGWAGMWLERLGIVDWPRVYCGLHPAPSAADAPWCLECLSIAGERHEWAAREYAEIMGEPD